MMNDPGNSTYSTTAGGSAQQSVSSPSTPEPASTASIGRYRWRICALLFFATTINYIDRYVLGVLAPLLQTTFGWSELQYGYIVTAFQAAYAIGLLVVGNFIDKVGTRIGYAVVVVLWSLAAMGHSLVQSVFGFGVARFFLGLGESGNFPAAVKTVAEWFPKKERALATGIFNSGPNVGATIAPLVVPWIAVTVGWRWAFLFTGFFSAVWLVAWLTTYRPPREHPSLSPAELAYIYSDPPEQQGKVAWGQLLGYRQTWALLLGKFLTDPTWWFLLFWLPKYLNQEHGLTITKLGLPLIIIYNVATAGSIFGGWMPAWFLRQGWSLNRARKTSMLVCAIAVTPVMLAGTVHNLWAAVALMSLATACHQGWSANLLTMASDMFPRRAVASVVGIGSFGGAVGGMLIATFTGFLLQVTGSYVSIFVVAGSTYLVALLSIQMLVPRLQPAPLEGNPPVSQ